VREVAASAVQARSEPGADLLQEFQQRGPSKARTLDEQDPYAD
jgi:hypothetical protein